MVESGMKKAAAFAAFLIFIYLCSSAVRFHQHLEIAGSPVYRAGQDIILTSADGYRWLRYAQGDYTAGTDRLSGVPDAANNPPARPLISMMVKALSDITGFLLQVSGSFLSVFLSGLFIFPLGAFFYMAGFPAAGAGAAVTGALSFAYLSRTSAFQIDTDMLNLFFISLGALFLIMAEKGREYIWSLALGGAMYVFWRWYFHSGFTLVYFVLLLFALRKKGLKAVLVCSVLYVLAASPFVFLNGFRNIYEFLTGYSGGTAAADIAELQVYSPIMTFRILNPVWPMAAAGLLLSFLAGKRGIYIAVFYALGVLAFVKGNRFAMYLAPLYGAGFGIVLDRMLKGRYTGLSCAAVTALFIISLRPALAKLPPPVVPAETYGAIKKLNNTPPDAVMAVLWDHGFMTEYLTGRAVMADGASQHKAGAEVFARVLFMADSANAAAVIEKAAGGRPVYLLFTPDMNVKLNSLIKTAGLEARISTEKGRKELVLTKTEKAQRKAALKLTDTLYFRLGVIGETDIKCFRPYLFNNKSLRVFRLASECPGGR